MAPSAQQRALVALMLAHGRIRRQFGDLLGSEGIGSSQYNILRILRGAGEPVPIMTIKERMMDPQPSITRLIDRLVERGLVDRTPCPTDRRSSECSITRDGLAMLDRLDGPVDRRDRELMSRLSEAELAQLLRLLEKVGEPR